MLAHENCCVAGYSFADCLLRAGAGQRGYPGVGNFQWRIEGEALPAGRQATGSIEALALTGLAWWPSLEYKGHDFYGPWFTGTDPSVSDFIYKDRRHYCRALQCDHGAGGRVQPGAGI